MNENIIEYKNNMFKSIFAFITSFKLSILAPANAGIDK